VDVMKWLWAPGPLEGQWFAVSVSPFMVWVQNLIFVYRSIGTVWRFSICSLPNLRVGKQYLGLGNKGF
jgi:hypothetical protein